MTSNPPREARWRTFFWTARAVRVRLRFLVVIVIASVVVGRWEMLRTHWDRWTGPAARDASEGAVSAGTEYFCPMDPGVLSDWPGKCSVCNMALVMRARGDMGPMPNGVVARVQLSPERIMLAGIRTSPVIFRPLKRKVELAGTLSDEFDRTIFRADSSHDGAAWLQPGLSAEVVPESEGDMQPAEGRVQVSSDSRTVTISLARQVSGPGRYATARILVPLSDREPFRSMPSGSPQLRPDEPRVAFLCPDHGEIVRLEPANCPKDRKSLDRLALRSDQRIDWWCPMHPKVVADRAGRACEECGGMVLSPRIVIYRPTGEVLAVPESAVIDTGTRRVVFVETMPGLFDAVEAKLGPRCDGWFAVIAGLSPGQKVATAGAFLIDAETRLNPGLVSGYFGANRGLPTGKEPTPAESLDFAGLSPSDTILARQQKSCPVTDKPLGSMGPPSRISIRGRTVFVCCDGCEALLQDDPDKYLVKLPPASKLRP